MKENVLDVLMYLFENYMDEDSDIEPDREILQSQLLDAGFADTKIDKAFDWLEGLGTQDEQLHSDDEKSIRLYTHGEQSRLDTVSRGYLLFLEQIGVLSSATRELVIDRVMALEETDVDLEELKWIVMMVLFNLPGQEAAYSYLEEMVFHNTQPQLH